VRIALRDEGSPHQDGRGRWCGNKGKPSEGEGETKIGPESLLLNALKKKPCNERPQKDKGNHLMQNRIHRENLRGSCKDKPQDE